ncbi:MULTISPECIES: efflux RND transporter periplasmic adaptor subunit [Marinobacter]|jgi:RND family efflux transporter MFP subunit|uniref:Efflux RND transporter periplasmic adaptor subunit n=1 Tax=Marinobacter nauticus TaxID=2743 RepID=A0A350RWN8_MARNT|nr:MULTISPECIES: efflux RND transporter periplasmic adaptor subunit [Marinobacter]MEC7432899.1 efflux RND transporter periplasmic adaptor subunit [Pseudomonadota bacterium]MAC24211.1 efflux transporter periplasmic adaptor subunit [Marinobacter sp.]MAP32041.1 efflux transporter periplasmic adaptor subunit [Marinobacter sp.]MBY6192309.1 efflux RND transporter periplasmic adaptor subunit [Marinobacter nauticus]MBY6213457.1 efflux RND transporter periplasmic adaptor subunit [Marinobacter nauticus]|tara:strand:+ start:3231 stop:4322 length:1092 start_codon:yes stop_codon:yes gene_type:complete
MSLTLRHSPFVLASALLAVLSVSGCRGGGTESGENAENTPVSVRVSAVTGGQMEEIPLRFSGIVRAAQRATLTFQVSGTLKERPVELGQTVKPGDVLARLYNPALEPARDSAAARLDELRTQFEQAQREWERSSRLHQRGVVSEQTLEQIAARRDSLRASMATAEASLAEATRLLEESVLKAPFAGQVEALLVERDEFVGAGQPVMRLSSPLGREVEVRVPAHLLGHVRIGQELPVWLVQDRNREPATGTVVEIAQGSSIRGELHPVLVSLPPNSLSSGEPVEVGIAPVRESAITVPLLAVVRDSTGTSVFRVQDQVAQRVPVQVDRVIGERVMVHPGALSPGDQVVYAGMTRLVDGDTVEVR